MSYENMVFTCPHRFKIAECSDKGCAQINAAPRVLEPTSAIRIKDNQSRGGLPVSQ